MLGNKCKCATCCGRTYGKEAREIARKRCEQKGLPKIAPLKRWAWLQDGYLCECFVCRQMGEENNIHFGNVNDKMTKPSFYHKGDLISQYWCVGPPWGLNWTNEHDHIYYPPSVLNR